MARKTWSNLFLLLAAVNLAVGFGPGSRIRLFAWLALPLFLFLGTYLRRRMI